MIQTRNKPGLLPALPSANPSNQLHSCRNGQTKIRRATDQSTALKSLIVPNFVSTKIQRKTGEKRADSLNTYRNLPLEATAAADSSAAAENTTGQHEKHRHRPSSSPPFSAGQRRVERGK
jgi:hypothetical protein